MTTVKKEEAFRTDERGKKPMVVEAGKIGA
jgi:hypothetical protein